MIDLKNLIVDSKEVVVDFPGIDGFSVTIAHLSKDSINDIRQKCTTDVFDRKTRQMTSKFDGKLFVEAFSAKVIKGWSGLKLKHLESLVVVDLGDQNVEDELPYSEDNAFYLIMNSTEFDNWLNEVVLDLETFRSRPTRTPSRPSEPVSQ